MKAVQQIIRLLVIILLTNHARCQDGFSDRDILRYQQIAANESPIEAIANFNTNIQRDPSQLNPVNVQYHTTDDTNDYNRADRTRPRKVYRIKNPFQNQLEEVSQNEGNGDSQDSGTAASNQYASMQYSLPPEEFLQRMRDNQYQQQQQTTPAPNLEYTATPLPQYQYSTISSNSFDNTNQQSHPISQLEPKSHQYLSNNGYQFNPQNTFRFDSVPSTPSPVTTYLSTALPDSQYVGSSSSYVSSSSPIFLSSPSSIQYVSSPLSNIQTGTPDYNNRITSTIVSNLLNYNSNDQNKKLQIDHYDNSANGIRYPVNVPQQYQNEYDSSTLSPTSVSYSDSRDIWQNNLNPGVNALSKSLQEVYLTQNQNYPNNQQEARSDSTLDSNSETHRIGAMTSANNVFLNFAQPDYQTYSNGKSRTRDTEQETGQPEYYSNGEYGWKLTDRKPQINNDGYYSVNSGNYQRYQPASQNTGQATSQMTFHIDTSKPSNYDQVSKSATDGTESQEFAKAAAKAHEFMKQQQGYYGNSYSNTYSSNQGTSYNSNPYYGTYDKQNNKYTDVSTPAPYLYSSQPDLITASPYYYNSRENSIDNKPKHPFDHEKALKTIVPIDVSNVVSNADSQLKGVVDGNRYAIHNYGKEQVNQNQQMLQQQQYRPLSDSYFKDKNAFYGLNIKTKPDEYQSDNLKQFDINTPYYAKPQLPPESIYNQGGYSAGSQRVSYNTQHNLQESIQSPVNVQQGLQRPQIQVSTDINSILKLNDVPYQLSQNLSPDSFRFQNNEFDRGSLPTRINQEVASHQLDVASNLLSKLLLNKQAGIPFNRPDFETQATSGISTINGFKVANPFNVDLKLVAEILKGKGPDTTLRDQFSKQAPQKIDLAQLQYLLKNDNIGNLASINEGLSALSNPFIEVYNSGRIPYQGVKYSRSQEEEEETIVPIADASSNHPIGAVTDQSDPIHEREAGTGLDAAAQGEESIAINFEEDRAKKSFVTGHRMVRDRHRHPNSLTSGRHSYQRKYPKSEVDEPYPLLKPPPPHSVRGRGSHFKPEKQGRRRRMKPRVYKIFKSEPLFEAENENEDVEYSVPTVLKPPPPVAESKSDNVESIEVSS